MIVARMIKTKAKRLSKREVQVVLLVTLSAALFLALLLSSVE